MSDPAARAPTNVAPGDYRIAATAAAPLKVALIGGSGLGESFHVHDATAHELDTPFGRPSGPILETTLDGMPALLLTRHGPGHALNPGQVPYRANIFALKQLGATHVLASGAVGSLREEYRPRELVIPDQAIDKTNGRAKTFYEHAAVHVEFADPFCPVLRRLLLEAASEISQVAASGGADAPPLAVHNGGCYVCMEGPAFSTRSESHMHRLWGGDLIGMTLMPEAKLAREAELPYAAVCLVTDYDCWRPHVLPDGHTPDPFALLSEILANLQEATARATALLQRALGLMSRRQAELSACPAREALRLGIWTDKRRIDPAEVRRLWPLWGRHFEPPGVTEATAGTESTAVG